MRKDKPIGVTMDLSGNPNLLFSDGCTYLKEVEQILYEEYFPNGQYWPVDPETGEKLSVANRDEIESDTTTRPALVPWAAAGTVVLMLILFCLVM